MAEALGDRHEQAVVGLLRELERAAGLEAEAAADQHPRDVLVRVAVALPELVRPDDGGVVQHVAPAVRLRGLLQALREESDLFGEPGVDLGELFDGTGVEVRIVRERVVAFFDADPLHARAADGIGELERRDARQVVLEGADQELGLQARDLRDAVVVERHAGLRRRRHLEGRLRLALPEAALEFAQGGRMLVEQGAVAFVHRLGDLGEVVLEAVEDGAEVLAFLHRAVELVEELIRTGDRRDGLVGAGVAPAGPRIGAVADGDAEFEGAEAGLGPRVRLQVRPQDLVDGRTAGPAGRRAAAAHDVAGEEFDAGKQAAHAAHVRVAVAADAVVHALEREQPVLERLEGLHDRLEPEVRAFLVGPEGRRDDAVGREDEDDALAAAGGGLGGAERGQSAEERERGGRKTEAAEEFAAMLERHGLSGLEGRRWPGKRGRGRRSGGAPRRPRPRRRGYGRGSRRRGTCPSADRAVRARRRPGAA